MTYSSDKVIDRFTKYVVREGERTSERLIKAHLGNMYVSTHRYPHALDLFKSSRCGLDGKNEVAVVHRYRFALAWAMKTILGDLAVIQGIFAFNQSQASPCCHALNLNRRRPNAESVIATAHLLRITLAWV